MTSTRVPKPLLLLLLVVAALLAPASPATSVSAAAAPTLRPAASASVTAARSTGSRANHRSDRPLVSTAAAQPKAPLDSTPARDVRPSSPRLLLQQRPRPPTSTHAASAVSAPTGRSPPSPAGT